MSRMNVPLIANQYVTPLFLARRFLNNLAKLKSRHRLTRLKQLQGRYIGLVQSLKSAPLSTLQLLPINSSFYGSWVFPHSWSTARIEPLSKRGSKTLPLNYRPIVVPFATRKVLEKHINQDMLKHIEFYKLICRQYGFSRQRSTANLQHVTHIWNDTTQSYRELQIVALIISKAFDQMWHAALLIKLLQSLHK